MPFLAMLGGKSMLHQKIYLGLGGRHIHAEEPWRHHPDQAGPPLGVAHTVKTSAAQAKTVPVERPAPPLGCPSFPPASAQGHSKAAVLRVCSRRTWPRR